MPVTRELVENAIAVMRKNPANYVYFFDTLKSPEWIKPLSEHGFFRNPPEPIQEEDTEQDRVMISFPPWPESRYLARVAAMAPDCVLRVMLQLEATDNAHVHWDLVEAACAMPACHAAKWAKKEAKWIAKQNYLYMLLPDRLGKLIEHLATGDETQAALAVAAPLLSLNLDHSKASEDSEDWPYARVRLRAKFQEYEYKDVLEASVTPLLNAAGAEALSLLCDLVDRALEESTPFRQRQQEEFSKLYEGKKIQSTSHSVERTRPRGDLLDYQIELIGDDSSHLGEPEDKLIASLRDTSISLIKSNKLSVKDAIGIFDGYSWRIFCRISLHILRTFLYLEHHLVAERLTDGSIFGYRFLPREYDLLLRDYFPIASAETKQNILGFIEQRVNVANIRGQQSKADRTQSELQRQVNLWKLNRLSTIRSHLPSKWQQRYEELSSLEGLERYRPSDPEHVSRPVASTPGSPKTQEQLASMSIDEIVAFLKTWDSPSWEESPDTLGRYLSNLVSAHPQRFAESARAFRGLDATYVHAIIGGLREAVKSERPFDWEPVLELCKWVVAQPYEIPGRNPNGFPDHKDPHWGWSFKAVADLLQIGLAKGKAMIPYTFRACVWQMIEALTKDSEPTPEYEARHQSSPTEDSISTTRGAAMHSVIAYGHWVRGNLEEKSGEDWRGFEEMPEVQAVLEHHLDVSLDPALAIRAVYGRHIPDLDYLDHAWTSVHLECIFPHDETSRDYWNAAWDPFIRFARPVASVFHQLEGEYRQAIARFGSGTDEDEDDSWALQRLAEEMMYFYWHGELTLDDPNGLLPFFYKNAPSSLRAKAHESVGRWLKNHEGSLDGQIIQRLKLLWLSRLRLANETESQAVYKEELAAFGWWFASGRFDDSWALDRLTESIGLARDLDDKSSVVERLASFAPEMPDQVARALYLIVESADYLKVYSFADDATKVLYTLLASGSEEAIEQARRTIDRLLSLGHRDFRDLIKSAGN